MTIKLSKQEVLAQEVGSLVGQVGSIQKDIDTKCQAIRTARKGKPVGTVKSGDAVMIRFMEAQQKLGLADQTIKNNLTTFRKAINEGKKYDVNANRSAKRGTKSSEANTISVKLTIKGEPSEAEVASMLRDAVNAEKFRESYAQLAAFLVDALDEYDGE